jgi:hypothetical protein
MPEKNWNRVMVGASEALDIIREPDGTIDWGEINIAHLDTGITRHPVFGDWSGPDRTEHETIALDRGVNYREPGTLPLDPLTSDVLDGIFAGHGTRTLSVLAGHAVDGFEGIAPGAPVVPYRVADTVALVSKTDRNNVARAIRHAVETTACEVISISMGFPFLDPFGVRPLGEAVDFAYGRGVIVVAAGGQVVDVVSYPGKFWRTIGVGGVKPDSTVYFPYARWMNDRIDVWAPSQPVYRANSLKTDGGFEPEEPMRHGHGTSYGAVHVAAAAAMWLVHRGDEIHDIYDQPWQRIEAFRTLLAETGGAVEDDIDPFNTLDEFLEPITTRILNIKELLQADLPDRDSLEESFPEASKEFI